MSVLQGLLPTLSKLRKFKSLKFFHDNQGVTVSYKHRKFIIAGLSVSKDEFTFKNHLDNARIWLTFHCMVRKLPLHPIETLAAVTAMPKQNDYTPIYKYVSSQVFSDYVSKGIFQLGTIDQYRNIENIKQRDEFEGYGFFNFRINDHLVSVLCSTGFNYSIFCATRLGDSPDLRAQFGERRLYIHDVRGFAESVCKTIKAKNFYIQSVEYNTLQLYIDWEKRRDPRIEVPDSVLSPAFFDLVKDHSVYPCLFVKPDSFRPENEVRIAFEMSKDISAPIRFQNKELLKYIAFD